MGRFSSPDAMARITLYTTQVCPYCVQAKRLLIRKGVNFEEIDVTRDPELRRKMVQMAGGRMTVPQIFVDGKHIGDCDEIYVFEKAGKLDAMLNPAEAPQ
jgi:glutaredoxin 3